MSALHHKRTFSASSERTGGLAFKALARCHHMTDAATLTDLEFASLQEVGSSFCHDAIPADHQARLLALGLIYALLGSVRVNTAGRARMNRGYSAP
jgi:hypothetical protein